MSDNQEIPDITITIRADAALELCAMIERKVRLSMRGDEHWEIDDDVFTYMLDAHQQMHLATRDMVIAKPDRSFIDFGDADRGIETIDELIAAGDTGERPENKGLEPPTATESKPGKGFILSDSGVFSESDDGEPVWICSRLDVIAKTRNSDGEAWGRLLEWHDPDGRKHRWDCPEDMLAGDGLEFRRVLMSGGLEIAAEGKARQDLQTYVQTYRTEARAVCTDRTRWNVLRLVKK